MGNKKVGVFMLAMLITGSIDSIRNLPATALFGDTLVFFFIAAALVFLLPAAFISAELSSTWTKQGGVYEWVRMAFGERIGFLAIWLQWINTMVWYPTILLFIAGTASYFINPQLASNKIYLVSVILVVFWLMTLINLKGLKTSATFASYCAVIGMIIPMLFIIGMGVVWIVMGKPMQLHWTVSSMMPHVHHTESWVSLTAILTAFLGMELATVHVRQVEDPQRNFPRAILLSVVIIVVTMMLGSFAIAMVLPHNQIELVDGVMQAFSLFLKQYHLLWFKPILIVMLLIGSVGGMINWIISPAKGLMRAGAYGFLPSWLSRENRHGVAHNLLILQAVLVSLICLAFLLMPSVNGSYWLLTDLSTELYMMMYVLMFMAAIVLRHKYVDVVRPCCIPGGKIGMWLVAGLGLLGCIIALFVGFIPPEGINVGGRSHYHWIFLAGIVLMILPVFMFYRYEARDRKHAVQRG